MTEFYSAGVAHRPERGGGFPLAVTREQIEQLTLFCDGCHQRTHCAGVAP